MELTLKNVKVLESMSEETTCFSATIYIDGKRAGHAGNRGCGGPHDIDWTDRVLGARYEKWLKDEPVPVELYDGKIMLLDNITDKLETMIDDALNVVEQRTWLKRQCKNKTLFKLKDDDNYDNPAAWWVVKAPFSEITKHKLQQRYGENLGEIANERFV
jgi:hypothetical protein